MIKIGSGLLAGVLAAGRGLCAAPAAAACLTWPPARCFPTGAGGMAFLNYDYQDQNQNWSGTSSAPAANNDDKEIETHFVTLGLQYMFNRSWGAQMELPYWSATFIGDRDTARSRRSFRANWSGLGDIRLKGIYTGFSEDLSSGVTFGLKLPTGSYNRDRGRGGPRHANRHRQHGHFARRIYPARVWQRQRWNWFAQAELDVPVLKQGDYRPGLEADAAAGIYYDDLSLGRVQNHAAGAGHRLLARTRQRRRRRSRQLRLPARAAFAGN